MAIRELGYVPRGKEPSGLVSYPLISEITAVKLNVQETMVGRGSSDLVQYNTGPPAGVARASLTEGICSLCTCH